METIETKEYTGYCMNGGYCFYLREQQRVACKCPYLYGGKRCEKIFMVYLKTDVENVYIKCGMENLDSLEEQRSFSARDERLIFRKYVLALCHEMAPSGKITQLQPKIIKPRINQVYKKSKVYRLAMDIQESTWLIAENDERVWAGYAIEYCPHRYHHPSRIHCFLLAFKFKQSFADEFSYLRC